MRCEVKAGFLMLRHCNRVAADKCCFCGIGLCADHSFPLTREQVKMYGVPESINGPISCQPCIQQHMQGATGQPNPQAPPVQGQPQQGQPGQPGYYDPYPYHYYGGYHPYYWGDDFSDRDRRVFHHSGAADGTGTGAETADPLES
jgi:hypothetical protein